MKRTIENSVKTLLLQSGTPASFCAECFYAVCDACNRGVRAGHSRTPEEMLTGVKPTIRHIRLFRCKVCITVPDKTRKTLKTKAYLGTLLRSLSYEKYRVMMESERTVHTSWHCIANKRSFPTKKSTRVFRTNKNGVDQFTVGKDNGSF